VPTNPPDGRVVLVLYDADCGLCTRTARVLRRLDRRRALCFVPAQAADGITGAPSLEIRLAALQVRDADGTWMAAGTGLIRIADAIPVLRPVALLARLPGMRRGIDEMYAVVAANRRRISRVFGDAACPLDPAAR